ncbi:hypothetical protein SC499_10675 [Peribacillus simplex]|uniref:hypothetical protein n=1 Tax=Peribacillus simplex TaxID=1478 RepID=UPI00298E390F|nr:hypothetical protein [Peribacillus simplex]MDW7615175.1 hypothetical protein [Peribacillus simplex]
MERINPILMEFLLRSVIKKLPDIHREVYQYIESMEYQLEEVSVDEKQFLQLMIEKSPFKAAADHFSLHISTIKEIMDEAQMEIDKSIDERCNRIKWIDYTDKLKQSDKTTQRAFIFLS